MDEMEERPSPLNPLPPVVWLLALPVIAMELVLAAGGSGLLNDPGAIGWRQEAAQRFGLPPGLLQAMWEAGVWTPDYAMRFVTYVLVQPGTLPAVFVAAFLLALGKFVGEVFRWWAVLAVVLAGTLAGALAWQALPIAQGWLVGGYPAVYGLIGAFTFILWVNLGRVGANRARAFVLIGMLLLFQLVFGLLFGGGYGWVAEIAGFAAGFLTSFVVAPGGWQAVVARLKVR